MNSLNPLVSIITPCYNGEHCVSRLMDSIIAQTYRPIEFILVNDGSTDGTHSVVDGYAQKFKDAGIELTIINQDNKGLGGAINAGLKQFTGAYFCWPDADDFLETTSVEERVKVLEANPEYAVVTSNAYYMNTENMDKKWIGFKEDKINTDTEQFLHHLNADSIFCSGCHMVRTSMFLKVYPEREIYPARRGQNWQILLPLYFKYKRYFLNLPLYNYVISPNSMSKDSDDEDSKISRFSEHEEILNNVLVHIERTQNVNLSEYKRFLDDKYSKLRMEVFIKYNDKSSFNKEYKKKQQSIGIDIDDRIACIRQNSRLFNSIYGIAFRLTHKYRPEEIPEHLLHKINKEGDLKFVEPRVSVLIPVYNGEKYIDQCFECLIDQRYSNIEVIVVNDGSVDDTEQKLVSYEEVFKKRGYAYRHIYQQNARLAVAMNNALQYVTGKYIMIYEIDDILYKDGILDKVIYLENNPNVSMVRNNGYYIKNFDEIERNLFIYKNIERDEEHVFDNIFFGRTNNWPASYMVRTSDFLESLGKNRKIYEHPGGTHLQFMLPMAFKKKVGFIDKPLMDYYAHVDSDSHSGGYEAALKRSVWYEEIRVAILNQLDMPTELKNEYTKELHKFYTNNKLKLALKNRDRANYLQYANELHYSHLYIDLMWVFHRSAIYRLLEFVCKAWGVINRKAYNTYSNLVIWTKNKKGYDSFNCS